MLKCKYRKKFMVQATLILEIEVLFLEYLFLEYLFLEYLFLENN